jgi:hypothetical protein
MPRPSRSGGAISALLVGAVEPEVQPAARGGADVAPCATQRRREGAERAVELVIVDRDPAGFDAAGSLRVLATPPRDAWLLAITVQARGRMADAVLDTSDDYYRLQRADCSLARGRPAPPSNGPTTRGALMLNVPGRFRSAWHVGARSS